MKKRKILRRLNKGYFCHFTFVRKAKGIFVRSHKLLLAQTATGPISRATSSD